MVHKDQPRTLLDALGAPAPYSILRFRADIPGHGTSVVTVNSVDHKINSVHPTEYVFNLDVRALMRVARV